jgi:hypothetical protein
VKKENQWDILYKLDMQKRANKEQKLKEQAVLKEIESLKECTFQPKLESNNSNTRKYMTGSLYERNLKWQ